MRRIDKFEGPYRFLSNFWLAAVFLDGHYYRTVEHAYQAAKTLDPDQRAAIRAARQPGEARRLGRTVTLREDWEAVKEGIMLDLLRQKFAYDDLGDALLATGTAELVEGNHWRATYWGVCNGVGQNRLGTLLMQVRSVLAAGG